MEHYDELLTEYALNDQNYKGWRNEHTKIFGDLFSSAFEDQAEAQIHLTAALINISKRDFVGAMPKLNILESIAVSDFDRTVVNYFIGLNYELLENEEKMNEYYQKVRASDISLSFPLPFHPYYRTAKFAQRASECAKSIFYYQEALSFYDGMIPDKKSNASVSQIIYDIATVHLYMHKYDECEKFLALSQKYDSKENPHRSYVTAILYAIQGKQQECQKLLKNMNAFLKANCEPMVEAILAGRDLHYCAVPQNRDRYSEFWDYVVLNKQEFEEKMQRGEVAAVQTLIANQLSETFAFMKKSLDCLVELKGGLISVYCKNYCVKTLMAEHEFLFLQKPQVLENWEFISVDQFQE